MIRLGENLTCLMIGVLKGRLTVTIRLVLRVDLFRRELVGIVTLLSRRLRGMDGAWMSSLTVYI